MFKLFKKLQSAFTASGNSNSSEALNLDKSSEVVIALVQTFIAAMHRIAPDWNQAFWRFESEASRFGSNASYLTAEGIFLVPSIKEGELLDAMNSLGRQLWQCEPDPEKRFCVCLLTVSAPATYEIKFERENLTKWQITKLGGKSGMPEGL